MSVTPYPPLSTTIPAREKNGLPKVIYPIFVPWGPFVSP